LTKEASQEQADVKRSLRGVWQEQATMKHGELCWVFAGQLQRI
jgi:hypothetical protein